MMPGDPYKEIEAVKEGLNCLKNKIGALGFDLSAISTLFKLKEEEKMALEEELFAEINKIKEDMNKLYSQFAAEWQISMEKFTQTLSKWAVEGIHRPRKKKGEPEEPEYDEKIFVSKDVLALVNKYGEENRIDTELLELLAKKKGITKERLKELIDELKKEGILLESYAGILQIS
jgi:uncharacterized membrane protein